MQITLKDIESLNSELAQLEHEWSVSKSLGHPIDQNLYERILGLSKRMGRLLDKVSPEDLVSEIEHIIDSQADYLRAELKRKVKAEILEQGEE